MIRQDGMWPMAMVCLDWVPRVPRGPGGRRADQPVLLLPQEWWGSQGSGQDTHMAGMGVTRLWPRHPHGRYGGHKAVTKTPTWQVWGSQGCGQDTHMAGMGVTRLWPRHPHGRYGGHKAVAKTPTWQVWGSQSCGQDTHMLGMRDRSVVKMPKWQVW